MAPHLCGASLLASRKKSGDLRPIAVGEVLRRLVSKCITALVTPQVKSTLPPHQLGVCSPNGAESLVHSVKLISSDPDTPLSSKNCLLVDFSNAFNSKRSALFKEVQHRMSSLSSWIEFSYGGQSHLLFGEHTILSSCGVQQGDPLGPLLFSLVLQPIIEKIASEVPSLLFNGWYLDDGILCGNLDDIAAALSIIAIDGPTVGLSLNRSKSLLFSPELPSSPPSSLAGIPVTSEGFLLLWAPVGPPHSASQLLQKGWRRSNPSSPCSPLLRTLRRSLLCSDPA